MIKEPGIKSHVHSILIVILLSAVGCREPAKPVVTQPSRGPSVDLTSLAIRSEMRDQNSPEISYGKLLKESNSEKLGADNSDGCRLFQFGNLQWNKDGDAEFEMQIDFAAEASCGDGEKVGYSCVIARSRLIAISKDKAEVYKEDIGCRQIW